MMGDRKRQVLQILGPSEDEKKHEGPSSLHVIAEELVDAVHRRDVDHVVHCFKAMFDELEQEPHEEYQEE